MQLRLPALAEGQTYMPQFPHVLSWWRMEWSGLSIPFKNIYDMSDVAEMWGSKLASLCCFFFFFFAVDTVFHTVCIASKHITLLSSLRQPTDFTQIAEAHICLPLSGFWRRIAHFWYTALEKDPYTTTQQSYDTSEVTFLSCVYYTTILWW